MTTLLSVNKLKKVYGGKTPFLAVDEISFDLKAGEILGFLGPNGSGKTTTIQMLLGTLSLTSGTITYFGKEFPRHRSEILKSISFASTYTSLPYILTVEESLKCFGRLYSLSEKEALAQATPLLDRFGLLEKRNLPISSLSAGQITRLMLVKAFFIRPKIALLDEPTASLDPDIAKEVCQFLLDQRKQNGLSILFTSHKMSEASDLCDRAIFLKDGKIIANDKPKNLAKSVSSNSLRLTIGDGLKRAIALAQKLQLRHEVEHRSFLVSMDEHQIPPFLLELMQMGVTYTHIQIEEPSLESYFLKIAERSK